jgi:hypothetical protein
MWQDFVFTFGSIGFTIALIPALRSKQKPPVSSSLLTGTFLLIFALTYVTLGLWLSVIFGTILALTWLTLALQAYLTGRTPIR